eukprot:6757569-Prymnesium_polylepis.1
MLNGFLQQLEIPSDARLVAVETDIDSEGNQTWTIKYKQVKGAVLPSAPAAPLVQTPCEAFVKADAGLKCDASLKCEPYENSVSSVPKAVRPATALERLNMERLFTLQPAVQKYAWGKIGEDSLVGRLAESGQDDFELAEDSPYAEMWMGTHPSGPSMVVFETPWQMVTPLSEWIKLNAEVYKAGSALVQR